MFPFLLNHFILTIVELIPLYLTKAYLGLMYPLIDRLGRLVASFLKSILPAASTSMVADPSTVKFNGNPDIVGMMMLLSKNIKFCVKEYFWFLARLIRISNMLIVFPSVKSVSPVNLVNINSFPKTRIYRSPFSASISDPNWKKVNILTLIYIDEHILSIMFFVDTYRNKLGQPYFERLK